MSSAESHLGFLNSIVRREERSCEGELCCLGHRRIVGTLCLLDLSQTGPLYERVSEAFCCSL